MANLQPSDRMNIFGSIRLLKGNTRVSALFEPMWGIPFVLFNFYLSLYMKELGVTDRQLGYLISIGFIAGTFISLFGGVITDRLGRKKTTAIFDFISWPLSCLVYAISNSFVLFAAATICNSFIRIVSVSWNLMVVEDADNEQRIAAFNLINIVNIATGIIIPLAGLLVSAYGVVISERVFLIFAFISMSTMIVLRNHFYKETKIGSRILEEHRKNPSKITLKNILPLSAARILLRNPAAIMVIAVFVLFNMYTQLGTINSLYFAPYMTEVLHLGKSTISILGGVYSAVMVAVFIFIVPVISRFNIANNMIVGFALQAAALALFVVIPSASLFAAVLSIAAFAVGFGVFRPFIDSLLAAVTDEKERAGIYSIFNTFTSICTAIIGIVSGSLYILNPRLIYIVSVAVLAVCIGILAVYKWYTGNKVQLQDS